MAEGDDVAFDDELAVALDEEVGRMPVGRLREISDGARDASCPPDPGDPETGLRQIGPNQIEVVDRAGRQDHPAPRTPTQSNLRARGLGRSLSVSQDSTQATTSSTGTP